MEMPLQTIPEHVQKELDGMRKYVKQLKRELLIMRRQEQGWRNERFLAMEQLRVLQRLFTKLDQFSFNVAWDTPNKTADYIRDYAAKVRKGLGLDK